MTELKYGVKYDVTVHATTESLIEGSYTGYEVQELFDGTYLLADPVIVDDMDDDEFGDYCADCYDEVVNVSLTDMAEGRVTVVETPL